jgi:hypothetical protein
MDFSHLKRVPPCDNEAPDIHPSDVPWSQVFDAAAARVYLAKSRHEPEWFLCHAVEAVLRRATLDFGDQAERMARYIDALLNNGRRDGWNVTVLGWLEQHNGGYGSVSDTLLPSLRTAWARHLAAQFRAKGL